ncbi:MAG TPA: HAD family hydrolase [Polyangiaceae bacterium LLY-WYZ-15_(1-7)]|nr:NLI interacting domain protein [Myxococcales bacterium]MAT28933.1 NLI interacting domain protein [Sandaracinus sp.]HJL00938.1 HAD family hydrolase [Polyangiaceae bacterium LLY-WYZ-15_(1-7)]MBJ73063.1 NLI interacting domain protein [Sandaracinus sp.]HJL12288.1 HAD family hydrolase [Polyangiaceae bacterium LLY-WYZ-15_(1-7)]
MPRFDKLLVLDLDETLLHTRAAPLDGREPHGVIGPWVAYRRPHVAAFLDAALDLFEVGVWTSAGAGYAAQAVRWLEGELAFVWSRSRCTRDFDPEQMEVVHAKPLRKLLRKGWRKEAILAVDDTPAKWRRSYGNLVRVAPFEGDPADDELPALLRYLEELGPAPNVRTIEKRGWRQRTVNGATNAER